MDTVIERFRKSVEQATALTVMAINEDDDEKRAAVLQELRATLEGITAKAGTEA